MPLKLFGLGILVVVGAWGKTYTYSYMGMPFDSYSDSIDMTSGPLDAAHIFAPVPYISGYIELSRPLLSGESINQDSLLVLSFNIAGAFPGPSGGYPSISISNYNGMITGGLTSQSFSGCTGGPECPQSYSEIDFFGGSGGDSYIDAEFSSGGIGYFLEEFGPSGTWSQDFTLTPEPGLYAALGLGLAGLAACRRTRKQWIAGPAVRLHGSNRAARV